MPLSNDNKFTSAYRKLAPTLLNHVFYRISDHEAAEDLVQEAFLKAWQQSVANKEDIQDHKKYLYKVANNLVIDHYRRKARQALSLGEADWRVLSYEPDYGSENDRAADLGLLKKFLPALKEKHRRVINYYFFHNLSITEISRLTGLSAGNISVIKLRGIRKLKFLARSGPAGGFQMVSCPDCVL